MILLSFIFYFIMLLTLNLSDAFYHDGKALASVVHSDFPSFLASNGGGKHSGSHNPDHPHWGYGPTNGPHTWTGICRTGQRQSPVDIRIRNLDFSGNNQIMERLHFINYDAIGELELKNTGHGVIVNGFDKWPSELRPYIQGGSLGAKYMLHQFHFHWAVQNDAGSEHTLNGLHYPVELHFVHIRQGLELPEALKESDGIAAVGVFYQIGMGKNANKAMAGLEKPLEHVIKKNSTTQLSDYSPSMHLPKNIGDFFRYNGSLTTPNCEEAVIWTLMANPVQITKEQLDLLRAVHSLTDDQPLKEGSYARSIRPLNGRRIQVRSSALEQLKKRRKERKHY